MPLDLYGVKAGTGFSNVPIHQYNLYGVYQIKKNLLLLLTKDLRNNQTYLNFCPQTSHWISIIFKGSYASHADRATVWQMKYLN